MTRPTCEHASEIRDIEPDSPDSCPECVALGDRWVHLRVCLVCGHVGCCDNSRNRHARKHFHESGHAVIQSYEPGESWRYCYEDDLILPPAPAPFRT